MSKSLSSLKNRRVNEVYSPPQQNTCSLSSQPQNTQRDNNLNKGLTLPQVIQIVDQRLILLEKFMNESKSPSENEEENPNDLGIIVNEFEKRFELLVEEIGNLKEIVLNLQAYTMNVNKVLFEERQTTSATNTNSFNLSQNLETIGAVEVNDISATQVH
jgi:hypothetical protein